jgi:hypothetical protein
MMVIWWSINLAVHLNILRLWTPPKEPEHWARYPYQIAREWLTDTHAELGFVAAILIVTIAPQFLNYILAGFSGCAATPRYVWQFEKIATWSLIKFLAAFGGLSVAEALGVYAGDPTWYTTTRGTKTKNEGATQPGTRGANLSESSSR